MYSDKINDPAFARYLQNSNRWSAMFSFILAAIAITSFYVAGEMGVSDLANPEALYIGLTIGCMFLAIALYQIRSRMSSKTWDGQVVDKRIEQKRRKREAGNNDYYWQEYLLYTVFVRSDSGKLHTLTAEDDDTVYNYYAIGDRVRHHGGLNSYEKLDKSGDAIIFCNACASLNDINEDYCHRCHCPLLK
ncbi:MAG TPA: hypothetical protein VD902_22655 [Symbiobacteriaceae bacterium]|nr:hypothetical protein [Symbiobacteriaceae bacterium]